MIYKRYVRTHYMIGQLSRYLLTNFGAVHRCPAGRHQFVCPPILRAFEIRDPLEYRDPVSGKKKVLEAGDVFRIVSIDTAVPRLHLHLERSEGGGWVKYGLCYGLDKKETGMLNWHAVRPPMQKCSQIELFQEQLC